MAKTFANNASLKRQVIFSIKQLSGTSIFKGQASTFKGEQAIPILFYIQRCRS